MYTSLVHSTTGQNQLAANADKAQVNLVGVGQASDTRADLVTLQLTPRGVTTNFCFMSRSVDTTEVRLLEKKEDCLIEGNGTDRHIFTESRGGFKGVE
ncbi:hypothetical protein Bpfe_028380 [Biomphalaria pfeifferi]|uniref:Uncharacterized protein n=1 Tax=Biomphalaria pfeifferi TaxID=112525 RepID=A0AAD8ATL1_BIOPF|nr:hypothetical protein Bpfe_028380 [Biomphalaria pfeifferi]